MRIYRILIILFTQNYSLYTEKNIHLRAGLSLCLPLHRSTSFCSSGFGSQQAIFSLAGWFLHAGGKHLATHNSEILCEEEKPYAASS